MSVQPVTAAKWVKTPLDGKVFIVSGQLLAAVNEGKKVTIGSTEIAPSDHTVQGDNKTRKAIFDALKASKMTMEQLVWLKDALTGIKTAKGVKTIVIDPSKVKEGITLKDLAPGAIIAQPAATRPVAGTPPTPPKPPTSAQIDEASKGLFALAAQCVTIDCGKYQITPDGVKKDGFAPERTLNEFDVATALIGSHITRDQMGQLIALMKSNPDPSGIVQVSLDQPEKLVSGVTLGSLVATAPAQVPVPPQGTPTATTVSTVDWLRTHYRLTAKDEAELYREIASGGITLDELKSLGVSEQLIRVINSDMKAEAAGGDAVITTEELEKFFSVIRLYADASTGSVTSQSISEALEAYKSAAYFGNDDLQAVKDARDGLIKKMGLSERTTVAELLALIKPEGIPTVQSILVKKMGITTSGPLGQKWTEMAARLCFLAVASNLPEADQKRITGAAISLAPFKEPITGDNIYAWESTAQTTAATRPTGPAAGTNAPAAATAAANKPAAASTSGYSDSDAQRDLRRAAYETDIRHRGSLIRAVTAFVNTHPKAKQQYIELAKGLTGPFKDQVVKALG